MKESWDKAIKFVLEIEGGSTITENPADPGGLTKYGISKKSYPSLDIRNLTEDQAKEIYRRDYWAKCGCDGLPAPVDCCVFDCAVNMGIGTALSLYKPDMSYPVFLLNRIDKYIEITRKNGNLKMFFRGWIIRISRLRQMIEGR